MKKLLTGYEKYKLIGLMIKSVTGVIGGSLILTEKHPYISLAVLSIGAIANEWVSFIKDKEVKSISKSKSHEPEYGC